MSLNTDIEEISLLILFNEQNNQVIREILRRIKEEQEDKP